MDYLLIKPDRSIVFPAMDYFSTVVRKASTTHRGVPIVLDMSFVSLADFSTAYVCARTRPIAKTIRVNEISYLKGVRPPDQKHAQKEWPSSYCLKYSRENIENSEGHRY